MKLADKLMRTGSMCCTFDGQFHLLLREQPLTIPCGPAHKKGGAEPELPEAVEIPPTFIADSTYSAKYIHVIVFEKDMKEVASSSVVGGSHALDIADAVMVGKGRVVARIMVAMRTHKKLDMTSGLILQCSITEQTQHQETCKDLTNWAYDRIDKNDGKISAHDMETKIVEILHHFPRDQGMLDSLPVSVSFADKSIVRKASSSADFSLSSSSSSKQQNPLRVFERGNVNEEETYSCRANGFSEEPMSIKISELKRSQEPQHRIPVVIQLTSDCGTNKHRKAGTWFSLNKVCAGHGDDASHDDTFIVTPLGETVKTRLTMEHFKESEVPLESDDDVPLET